MNDLISRKAAIEAVDSETVSTNPEHFQSSEKFIKFMGNADIASFGEWQWANGFNTALTATTIQLEHLPSVQSEPKWHDCDPTDKNTLPEPGSWAIWCDKEGHRIIARWKEDAIDHFWPDQRMFDFNLEDAVAWTEIPKRLQKGEKDDCN